MRSIAVLAAALGACGYQAGSFQHPTADFEGTRVTVGCIDAAVAPYADPHVFGPAAIFTVGNRCDAAVLVDLAVPATANLLDGRASPLVLRDPRDEVEPVLLEARTIGREHLEYIAPAKPAREVCFDLAGIDAEAPAREPVLVCLAARGVAR
jgi:hypothetical protein